MSRDLPGSSPRLRGSSKPQSILIVARTSKLATGISPQDVLLVSVVQFCIITGSSTMSTSLTHFTILDCFKYKLQCKLCKYESSLNSTRCRLEHLLRLSTSIKACTAPKSKLSAIQHAQLEDELASVDATANRRRTIRAAQSGRWHGAFCKTKGAIEAVQVHEEQEYN